MTPAGSEPDNNPRQPAGNAGQDDQALISRIAGKDAAALAALYDRHVDAVYSLALRIAGEPAEAEGVVQEVFAQVWFEAARYRDDSAATLRRLLELARELAIARGRGRNPAHDADDPDAAATVRLPKPALGLTDDMADPDDAARLRDALASLPLLTRLSIELAYFDGLTLAQIAHQLEQPKKQVHERIRSGLEVLRTTVEENAG